MSRSVIGNTPKTTIVTPYSNDYRIDVLIEGRGASWNPSGVKSSPTSITYSFAKTLAYVADPEDTAGFTEFTGAQKEAVRKFLALAGTIVNINFSEVIETASSSTGFGQIRMANNDQTSAGYALSPGSGGELSGDVFISNDTINSSYAQGTYDYDTLIHEITHAIGLKHPGNYNDGQEPSTAPGNYLASSEDSKTLSVVSYAEHPQGLQRIDFGPYDLLALDYLYGLRPYNTGSTRYSYSDSVGQQLQTIYDTDGIDTLDLSQLTTPSIINLNGGKSSSLGRISSGSNAGVATDNLQVAFGSDIEQVIGSNQSDQITGTAVQNVFTGKGGNDTLDGAGGIDTAIFLGSRSGYMLTVSATSAVVRDNQGADGTDTLMAVERLKFSDYSIALDLDGNAGKTARLLGAVFGKTAISNKEYVGIGLRLLDDGMSFENLGGLALQAAGATNSDAIVSMLWNHVMGKPALTAEKTPFITMLDSGSITRGGLVVLAAETSINAENINLVGLRQSGIEYL